MFFFKQKTAYELRISDWSSDVCSSDLRVDLDAVMEIKQPLGASPFPDQRVERRQQGGRFDPARRPRGGGEIGRQIPAAHAHRRQQIGRASCRGRVGQNVEDSEVAVILKKNRTITTRHEDKNKQI